MVSERWLVMWISVHVMPYLPTVYKPVLGTKILLYGKKIEKVMGVLRGLMVGRYIL